MTSEQNYSLDVPGDARRQLALGWLWLCVLALLGAGVFSVLLVVSRTPYLSEHIPWIDFFHSALVVHVDLSVLVWSLSFGGILWSLNQRPGRAWLAWTALVLACLGALVIILSPFVRDAQPLMSNYVPVLQHPLFFSGLLLFALGFALLVVNSMIFMVPVGPAMSARGALRFGLNAAAVSAAVALICFAWSYLQMPDYLMGQSFFELLFWGGGHVLQFTYTLLMLVCWLWLSREAGLRLGITPRVVLVILFVGLACVFVSPLIYLAYPLTTPEHVQLFTWLMRWGGSLGTLPLALAVLVALLRYGGENQREWQARSALQCSLFLFGIGGLIGFLISGSNVTIPAHYHGSIVGVTLAMMGVCYALLPRLGYPLRHAKLVIWQPILYATGQLMHVGGLVWSGGYGVQRKVAGSEQALDSIERVLGMGLMGLGGLISSIGGLLFLVIVLRALTGMQKHAHEAEGGQ
ncbi:MAG: cbb3-type cytochrome c oxidase subunit I [Halieaceae bacterium]|nr:cbb3-type cytochrome c oxidase subunit I [Halieaceae bacterium]MCP5166346.1 cbb3-type cytochrome c oxidase subunit I [Pseudomonadales bacterium]MCP5187591.1 cbb3-type cytochrome c oxidase subunit I [Pseudomonadales bacterium]